VAAQSSGQEPLHDLDHAVSQRTTELQSANEQLKKEIAERMQVEKALRLSEERFSKAFKASPIPLAIQSLRQETFVDANQGFQDLTGFTLTELVGHTPQELNLWTDPAENTSLLEKLHQQNVRPQPPLPPPNQVQPTAGCFVVRGIDRVG
jgi:PAS domain-containing protein